MAEPQRMFTKDEKEELLLIGDSYRNAIYSNPTVPEMLTQFSEDLKILNGEISKTIVSEIIHFKSFVIARDFFCTFRNWISELYDVLLEALPPEVSFIIDCRRKGLQSTVRKTIRNYNEGSSINLYDLIAFRVIIDALASKEELEKYCYIVKAVCISFFKGKFCILCTPNKQVGSDPLARDYIECKKSNGYQSIHLAFLTLENNPFEVQIRTLDMHEDAEYGLCSHLKYKEEEESLVSEYINFDPLKVRSPLFRMLRNHSVYDKIGLLYGLDIEHRQKTF